MTQLVGIAALERDGHLSITEYLVLFRETKSFRYLVFAAFLIIRQGRLTEACWSLLCLLLYRPSPISKCAEKKGVIQGSVDMARNYSRLYLSRDALIRIYGETFLLDQLPADFGGVRSEGIVATDNYIILGEYADNSARLVHAGKKHFQVYDDYNLVSGVRHIHSVHQSPCATYVFVSTGDSKKYLDKWDVSNNEMGFSARLAKRLAGYTAAVNVAGKTYFGTDFSSRPNYLETTCGEKYPFPKPAYKMFVRVLAALDDRYVIALNTVLAPVGDAGAISIFDTKQQTFIHCDFFDFLPHSADIARQDIKS
jgi:hypothetical protein